MSIFGKGSLLFGILKMRCPRCHEGKLFENTILSFKGSFEMVEDCPVCDQNFMPEPGFYYGAMLVSYILSSFFCLSFVYFCKLVLGYSTNKSFLLLILICSFAFIWVYRIARSIWINVHIPYSGKPNNKG